MYLNKFKWKHSQSEMIGFHLMAYQCSSPSMRNSNSFDSVELKIEAIIAHLNSRQQINGFNTLTTAKNDYFHAFNQFSMKKGMLQSAILTTNAKTNCVNSLNFIQTNFFSARLGVAQWTPTRSLTWHFKLSFKMNRIKKTKWSWTAIFSWFQFFLFIWRCVTSSFPAVSNLLYLRFILASTGNSTDWYTIKAIDVSIYSFEQWWSIPTTY